MIKALPISRSRFEMNFCLLTKPQNKAVSAQEGGSSWFGQLNAG